jgi:hypothetical protein
MLKDTNGTPNAESTPPGGGSVRILNEAAELLSGLYGNDLAALSVPFLNSDRYIVGTGDDVTEDSEFFIGKRICMVGAIIPTLKRLKELGIRDVTIIDKKKETQAEADFGHFVPIEKTAEALSHC